MRARPEAGGPAGDAGAAGSRTPPRQSANDLMTAVGLHRPADSPGRRGADPRLHRERQGALHPDRHGHLPCLCGRVRRPGHGAEHHRKRQGQPSLGLQRRGGLPGARAPWPGSVPAHAEAGGWRTTRVATGTRFPWSCAWTSARRPSFGGTPAGREGLRHGISGLYPRGEGRGRRGGGDNAHRPRIPPATATASSPGTGTRAGALRRAEWTARRSMSTPPPASPTAANSASAARWASPPRSCTPAAPWGCEELTTYKYVVHGNGQIR